VKGTSRRSSAVSISASGSFALAWREAGGSGLARECIDAARWREGGIAELHVTDPRSVDRRELCRTLAGALMVQDVDDHFRVGYARA
jgi:hypothetical protein